MYPVGRKRTRWIYSTKLWVGCATLMCCVVYLSKNEVSMRNEPGRFAEFNGTSELSGFIKRSGDNEEKVQFVFHGDVDTVRSLTHRDRNLEKAETSALVAEALEKEEDNRKDEAEDNEMNVVLRRRPRYGGPSCENFTLSLYRPGTFGLTGLVSYPGSGNTWARHLIEYATGIYTGSLYGDMDLFGKGFIGELEPWDSGKTIVQKLHYAYSEDLPFSKVILIIREPYKAIISFVQYLEGGHVGHAPLEIFQDKHWPVYVLKQAQKWITIAKSWLKSPAKLLVVPYELMVKSPEEQLRRICDFLQNDCRYLSSACFKDNMNGQFHRRERTTPSMPFPKLVRDLVDESIDLVSNLLVEHGHDPLPVSLYKYYHYKEENVDSNKL